MEKQIEEMARDICHLNVSCDECTMLAKQMGQSKERYCKAMQYARRAYEKGWCKQSEGEWIVDAWNGEKYITIPYQKHEHTGAYCSLCKSPALLDGAEFGVASNYCPNCGAKMKGGAE